MIAQYMSRMARVSILPDSPCSTLNVMLSGWQAVALLGSVGHSKCIARGCGRSAYHAFS
jgi:hypothetical protein